MERKKLIAFDLYDTCLTIEEKVSPYSKFFSEIGLTDKKRTLRNLLMSSYTSIEDILKQELPGKDVHDFLEEHYTRLQTEIHSAKLFPETQDTLATLRERGYRLAAISNIALPYIAPVERLLPHMFDYEVFSCDVGYIKPDVKIFQCLQNISGYDPEEMVMVGDSVSADIQGAKNANIIPIHIERSENSVKKKPECMQIASLAELLDIFEGIK